MTSRYVRVFSPLFVFGRLVPLPILVFEAPSFPPQMGTNDVSLKYFIPR